MIAPTVGIGCLPEPPTLSAFMVFWFKHCTFFDDFADNFLPLCDQSLGLKLFSFSFHLLLREICPWVCTLSKLILLLHWKSEITCDHYIIYIFFPTKHLKITRFFYESFIFLKSGSTLEFYSRWLLENMDCTSICSWHVLKIH